MIKGLKRAIIYDTDATFSSEFDSTSRTSATIVPNYPHLAEESACLSATTSSDWDNALACDQTATVRAITVTNVMPHDSFKNIKMKVKKLNSISDSIT